MSPVSVAIIGAGSMAREHARAFTSLPDVNVVGVYSRTRARAETLAVDLKIPKVCHDIASLKKDTDADLVVVAVPELAANTVAKACFDKDWAVLLEKPAGYDLADAENIAEAAKICKRPVMVGFNRRFYSSTAAIMADLESRDENRFVHVQDQQSFAEARRYNHPEPVVEKFMYANSVHIIDLITMLARGNPVEVKQVMPWRGGETEVVLAHIVFDSGDTALYEGVWQGPGPWACAVSTVSRRWVMQPLERATVQNVGERIHIPVDLDEVDKTFKPGFLRQAEAVVARVRGEPSKAVDLPESLKTMRLIYRIFGV